MYKPDVTSDRHYTDKMIKQLVKKIISRFKDFKLQYYAFFFWKCHKVADFHQHYTKMIWHLHTAVGEAARKWRMRSSWLLIKTGIAYSASGHHDDSSVWSALRWWSMRDDGGWLLAVLETGQTDRSRLPVTDTVLHCSLLIPFSSPLPACSAAAVLQKRPETNAYQYLFPWIPGGCCKDCCKAFSLTPLCLETMVLRPTPPPWSSLPLHTDPL